ncbi:hypothetical protein Q6A75_07365 [Aliarcobacter skirrowii]|uniref:hypothetical protein n=1 Tax=Aliarcobacter skirrowii TaxID=28200 RepID=UPI0029A38F04|nr:hypothetical protein [Aliarcobacter skirrowii]MDX4048750.1 hypothetical protein [Aliarcobacter skirrowii]
MDIEQIKQRIQKFSDDRNWDEFHNPKNLVMALNIQLRHLKAEAKNIAKVGKINK